MVKQKRYILLEVYIEDTFDPDFDYDVYDKECNTWLDEGRKGEEPVYLEQTPFDHMQEIRTFDDILDIERGKYEGVEVVDWGFTEMDEDYKVRIKRCKDCDQTITPEKFPSEFVRNIYMGYERCPPCKIKHIEKAKRRRAEREAKKEG